MITLGRLANFFIYDTSLGLFVSQARSGPNGRYRVWDLLISIFIIGILSVLAINIFTGYKMQAVILHCLGDEMQLRMQSQVYYSISGLWPDDVSEFETQVGFPYQEKHPDKFSYFGSVSLENGAIHYVFRKVLPGQTVTLRAAVLKKDPLGPVIWVAGDGQGHENWTIMGEDKTTVEPWMINRYLK